MSNRTLEEVRELLEDGYIIARAIGRECEDDEVVLVELFKELEKRLPRG